MIEKKQKYFLGKSVFDNAVKVKKGENIKKIRANPCLNFIKVLKPFYDNRHVFTGNKKTWTGKRNLKATESSLLTQISLSTSVVLLNAKAIYFSFSTQKHPFFCLSNFGRYQTDAALAINQYQHPQSKSSRYLA